MSNNVTNKPKNPEGHGEVRETIISNDAEFKGSIKFKDGLRLDGNFEGDINSDGTLFIGKSGVAKAEIKVGNIIVEGKSEGNITCRDKIELRSTAKIIGDITAVRLTIAEGVNIIGKCTVTTDKQPTGQGLHDFKKTKEEKPRVEKFGDSAVSPDEESSKSSTP